MQPTAHPPTVDLSLIIVSYNVRDFLEALLRSVERAVDGLTAEVIVVDNASTDGSVEMVRARYPAVRLIQNPENRGFAAANNQALAVYRGRYACLVNPDVLIQEDTLRTMVEFMDTHPDVGAAGCKVLNPDGTLQLACRRSIPTPLSAFFKLTGLSRMFPKHRMMGAYNLTYLDPDAVQDVDAVSGSFMVVRRDTIVRVGLLDESFFMYGEDLDWLYRMRQSGWRVCYVPATRIIHYKGESTKRSGRWSSVDFYRAMYLFARKHRPTQGTRLLTVLVGGLVMVGIVLKAGCSIAANALRRAALPLIDLTAINAALLVAVLIRVGRLTPLTADTLTPYVVVHGTYSAVWMGCLYLYDLYGHRRYSALSAALALSVGFVVIAALTYFTREYAFSRAIVLLSWGINVGVVAGWRQVVSLLVGARRRALIVGTDDAGVGILARLQREARSGYDVIGLLDTDPDKIGTRIQGVPVLNGNGLLSETLDAHRVDEVIVATPSVSYQEILQLIASCTRLGVGLKLVAQAGLPRPPASGSHLDLISLVDVGADPLAHCRKLIRRVWWRVKRDE